MLMHASFSASMLILQPPAMALVPGLAWNFVLAAAMWVVVAAAAVANRRQLWRRLSRPPLRTRAA
jgi:hypothetical protein